MATNNVFRLRKSIWLLIVLATSFDYAQITPQATPNSASANNSLSNQTARTKKVNLYLTFLLNNASHSVVPTLNVSIFNFRTSYQSFTITNESGEAVFPDILPGEYTVQVKGDIKNDIQDFHINVVFNGARFVEYLKVVPKDSPNGAPGAASISVAELGVPENAKFEQAKGIKDFQRNKFANAKKHFLTALKYCPVYASTMNDLGVLAIREHSMTEAEQWFRQAIVADANFPVPYLNLARIVSRQQDYGEVEQLVSKYLTLIPTNPAALLMLADSQLHQNRLDESLSNAHKVLMQEHSMQEDAHIIAAIALEKKNMHIESLGEYLNYMKDAPSGKYANRVHVAVQWMQAQYHITVTNPNVIQ